MLQTFSFPNRYAKPSVVARILGCSAEHIRQEIKNGKIQARITPSGRFLIPWDEVNKYLEEIESSQAVTQK